MRILLILALMIVATKAHSTETLPTCKLVYEKTYTVNGPAGRPKTCKDEDIQIGSVDIRPICQKIRIECTESEETSGESLK